MAKLSTPTRSPIGSPTELNRPRRILLQAQRATKHAIQTVQDSQHQDEGRKRRGPPYGTLMRRALNSRARQTTDRAAWAPLRTSRYAHYFKSIFTAFRTSRPHLLLSGLRIHIYRFQYFESIFTAFRTSRPQLMFSGLRVHIYCFPDFASTFTAFRTPRPHLLLLDSASTDFASTFTAFYGFRPSDLPLSTRLRPSDFTAFYELRPSDLLLSTGFRLVILLLSTGFGLVIYCFLRASA
ncbi:hypothetical protein CRG98_028898 [Punica granatum]|uniref:Uncharacterized protein n=1 Tax=Punica granatum TaxID=22663 RepID=A0A2I0J4V5_PUNGR|nr:hypothetical protein CRG98_028898 [Punica granatum]